LIAGFAIIAAGSVFAEDQNQDQKQQGKNQSNARQQGGKNKSQGEGRVSASPGGTAREGNIHNTGRVNNASSGQGHVTHVSAVPATTEPSNVRRGASQNVQPADHSAAAQQQTQVYSKQERNQVSTSRQSNQTQVTSGRQLTRAQVSSNQQQYQARTYTNQQQYTRSNNYGGLWFPTNTHNSWNNNWNHNNQYYYNNHNYGWYNGGWLIIDAGFYPYYANSGYSSGYGYRGSSVSSVQIRLTDQGYYHGPIDGDLGPMTRNAIADYQGDYGLRVTGRINDPLLQSLRL
jgi:hypothetical protein